MDAQQRARTVGMGPLALDAEGRCRLLFDDKFSVDLGGPMLRV